MPTPDLLARLAALAAVQTAEAKRESSKGILEQEALQRIRDRAWKESGVEPGIKDWTEQDINPGMLVGGAAYAKLGSLARKLTSSAVSGTINRALGVAPQRVRHQTLYGGVRNVPVLEFDINPLSTYALPTPVGELSVSPSRIAEDVAEYIANVNPQANLRVFATPGGFHVYDVSKSGRVESVLQHLQRFPQQGRGITGSVVANRDRFYDVYSLRRNQFGLRESPRPGLVIDPNPQNPVVVRHPGYPGVLPASMHRELSTALTSSQQPVVARYVAQAHGYLPSEDFVQRELTNMRFHDEITGREITFGEALAAVRNRYGVPGGMGLGPSKLSNLAINRILKQSELPQIPLPERTRGRIEELASRLLEIGTEANPSVYPEAVQRAGGGIDLVSRFGERTLPRTFTPAVATESRSPITMASTPSYDELLQRLRALRSMQMESRAVERRGLDEVASEIGAAPTSTLGQKINAIIEHVTSRPVTEGTQKLIRLPGDVSMDVARTEGGAVVSYSHPFAGNLRFAVDTGTLPKTIRSFTFFGHKPPGESFAPPISGGVQRALSLVKDLFDKMPVGVIRPSTESLTADSFQLFLHAIAKGDPRVRVSPELGRWSYLGTGVNTRLSKLMAEKSALDEYGEFLRGDPSLRTQVEDIIGRSIRPREEVVSDVRSEVERINKRFSGKFGGQSVLRFEEVPQVNRELLYWRLPQEVAKVSPVGLLGYMMARQRSE